MKHLILVRHGQSGHLAGDLTGGWTDTPLTELGRRQARATGQRLKRLLDGQYPRLMSSDLLRARETAEGIAQALGVPATFHLELRELNNGKAAGLTRQGAEAIALPMTQPTLDWVPYENAESWRMMTARVQGFLSSLPDTGDAAIIVSHGNAGVAIVHWWLGLPADAKISYELEPCSITQLGVNAWGEKTIVKLNDTGHLQTLGG